MDKWTSVSLCVYVETVYYAYGIIENKHFPLQAQSW